MRTFTTALVAALAIAAGSPAMAIGTAAVRPIHTPTLYFGSCPTKSTEVTASNDYSQTTSTQFTTLWSYYLTQSQTGCVTGTFFANAGNSNPGDHVMLQILLDGNQCFPIVSGYIFANSGDDFSSHATGFYCGGGLVPPGRHLIQVGFASYLGGPAQIYQYTWIVNHQ